MWSIEGEAARAVSGGLLPFAFHTEVEVAPWWEVDLEGLFPLEAIVIHNRQEPRYQYRARSIVVEVSQDRDTWTLIHKGQVYFGAAGYGEPLRLPINGKVIARYVRLSLAEREYLHLSRVEVFSQGEGRPSVFDNYVLENKLEYLEIEGDDQLTSYTLRISDNIKQKDKIVGLSMTGSARFGNALQQYMNIILVAKRTGLKYVHLATRSPFHLDHTVTVDGLTLIPSDAPLPDDGVFLYGDFFLADAFRPVLSPTLAYDKPEDEAAHTEAARTYIRPYLLDAAHFASPEHRDDELTIHIRCGDVFGTPEEVVQCGTYRQPPLSFYQLVVNRMRHAKQIERVLIVHEDFGNPCVEALRDWLIAENVPVRLQSGSLTEDIAVLLDAPHLVFGFGTFGYAICRLSKHIKTLHYFEPELGGRYAFIPGIDQVFSVRDQQGDYLEAAPWAMPINGEYWRNTPEQRQMMLTYPVEHLAIQEVGQNSVQQMAESKT